MTGARIRDRIEDFRRAGTRDKGFVLISTILLFALVSGTAYWMIGNTQRSIMSATKTSEFVQSGQLADLAIQDAMYQLNEVQPKTLPTKSSPRTGGTSTEPWSWYADALTDAAGGKRTVIHATGTYRDARREVQATVQSLQVGGFKSESDKSISYEIAPSSAFTYTLMGSSVTAYDGIGAPNPYITGDVGLIGSYMKINPYSGSTPAADVDYQQFGSAANAKSLTDSLRAPVGLMLDSDFILSRLSTCTGTAGLQDWTASAHGGVLTANGNAGCYKNMTFDVPTVIQGSGAFNAYVSGIVTFSENVSAATGTGLNIYTNSSVRFQTEDSSSSSLTVRNTFIYAPQGTCTTVTAEPNYRSNLKTLKFYGSLVCKTVRVAGQFRHVDPIGPDGDAVFGNTVWFLADYQQPSGSRIR